MDSRVPYSSWVFADAAEKFLHACLLMIQTLFMVFVRDSLVEVEWVARYPMLKESLIPSVCNLLAFGALTDHPNGQARVFPTDRCEQIPTERFKIPVSDPRWSP
jgi:hypothetical protein